MNLRASICLSVHEPEEELLFEEWLKQWKDQLTFVSDNYGCGCCVQLYDVEGSQEALDAIPSPLRCGSEWSNYGRKSAE